MTFQHSACIHYASAICVSSGLGGSPASQGTVPGPQPFTMQCQPGTCFQQNMCIRSESGSFRCAPCPDGYTGDGVHCDDVDEVWVMGHVLPVFIQHSVWQQRKTN